MVYERLGQGGMASVHRAEMPGVEGFRRSVALKRMLPHAAINRDLVDAFVREARIASYLSHGNIAQTYDLGKVDNTFFIAMEFVAGRNLRQILGSFGASGAMLPVPVALKIVTQICEALEYAHDLPDESGRPLGIIHRDVSLSNIIIADTGVVKLIDFGVAKASGAGMRTRGGKLKGKCGYMAPEYIRGSIDARADLFAVGVIAHELLTLRPLFAVRDERHTLQRVLTKPVEPPSRFNPAVPGEIDEIVMAALARDPGERWQHATALRTALATVIHRLDLETSLSSVAESVQRMAEGPTKITSIALLDDGETTVRPTLSRRGSS